MLSNTLRLNFCYLKIIHILHTGYHPKLMGHILKNKQKNNCACIREIIRSIVKMKMKMRSHRYDINRPRSRHEQKYSKYKKCLIMMMLICIEKYLSDAQLTWRSIQEKIKQRWGLVEKVLLIKKSCTWWSRPTTFIQYRRNINRNKTFLLRYKWWYKAR